MVMRTELPIVWIIDDEPDVRAALRMLIKSTGVHAESFANAEEFLRQFKPERPGCLIVDVRMPGMSGLDLQRHLRALEFTPPIIMISGHGEIPMAVQAVKDGAIDFLQKPFSDQQLIDRVQQALALDAECRAHRRLIADVRERLGSLTPREREVMRGVVDGRTNKTIAEEFGVSTRTVEIHRAKVMDKMQAESMSQLMRLVGALEGAGLKI